MTLRRHDLNLLPILDALLRHRNVTRAGKELGMSQSATSHALMRLRGQFGDPLLVRNGRETVLTHRAQAIAEPLAGILEVLDRLMATERFDPSTGVRRFKIGTADYVALVVLPRLANRLEQVAPKVSVHVTWAVKDVPEKLRSNQLDLALVPRGTVTDASLHSQGLFTDEMVVVVGAKNRAIGETLDYETYTRLPHAVLQHDNTSVRSFATIQEAENQVHANEALVVSDFLLLPFVIAESGYISLLHRRLAERLRRAAQVRIFPPPFPTATLNVDAYWSHAAHSDPGHRWFRELVAEICADL